MGESVTVKYLIIGGGAAGANGAVGIRDIDAEGSVLLVGQETWWPYDRPPLSKGMLRGTIEPADAESKDPSWYEKHNVQVKRDVKALSLDAAEKTVSLSDGSDVTYEKLLLATGSSPKKPNLKGIDLANVHLFRKIEDSLSVKASFGEGKRGVFIGASYIGVEVGSVALNTGVEVTFIEPGERPISKGTSPESGKFVKEYFEEKGAKFLLGDEVVEIVGENQVEAVVTKAGVKVPCDFVVIGMGVQQNLELAKEAGLELDEKHGVVADEYLQTPNPDIFVAGDIAAFQDAAIGKRWHAEHYLNAKWQGKAAGQNMAGAGAKYDRVPYFFSDFLDLHLVLRGDPQGGKPAKVVGDVTTPEFIELSAREDGTLSFGLGCSRDGEKADAIGDKLEELFKEKKLVSEIDESTFAG